MNIWGKFLNVIYPPRCCICGRFLEDEEDCIPDFCLRCTSEFPAIKPPLCTLCGVPFASFTEESHLCERCLRKKPYFDALGAPFLYEGGIMEAVHQLKYRSKTHLSRSLGKLLSFFALGWLGSAKEYLMMPVPLHRKKLRERGFNQSLLLSKTIRHCLNMELDFLSLRRRRYTPPQTSLSREERRKNVRKAFEVSGSKRLEGRTIILVDDVATTGSTLNECARVLKNAGCDKVLCLVLSRTSAQ